ncbi:MULTISPECIES: Rieske (2Fe-2S) protein [Pseudomonas]|jgi:3-phenylpropionate/trans-cinnamate dioxygenase ferredoxin subunit|uniref:(2Fe-2S)-binding protein n=1 Tax=Pseudomonas putida S12 TaxID=1215087 RepID=A0AA34RZH7_PSEPU|nr:MULTISPECIES: Rieske 2Fe-2S domain-containing protein [Pseudomonas]AJA16103.1 (2Fe-2S)-binding protein [Pseudomonas putida S12]TFW37500.1 (2Fe-2S)-binding protein [Pseudomonas putida]USX35456.1 Rieske 2Fe-2S domain-containing protein [Pseudomonas putida]SIS05398.1 Ferredoxin subunit of nitrite reductase or a ring-hydroxylating dioxygenase [Pseudomonas putida]
MSLRIALNPSQLPERNGRVLLACEGRSVALFNVAGALYAIDDSCPHQGASLCGGRLEGRVIQCCAHGLRFDLASGYLVNSKALKVASYPVQQEGDAVFITLDSDGPGEQG